MSRIASKGSRIQKVADGFKFTEGPVWHKDGYLLFSDIPANKIMKYEPGKAVSMFMENSGFAGTGIVASGPGSNGLTFDKSGNLIICQHGARQVVKFDRAGNLVPVARQFGGKRLNSPNDAVVMSNGIIFFTDPPWGLPKNIDDPAKELDFQGVYRLRNGSLELIDRELMLPNGIALSPDEKWLYVAETNGEKKQYFKYAVDEEGNVSDKLLFFDASALGAKGSPDGIKVDKNGNCYFTGPGGVLVISSKGEHLGTISPPQQPSNIGWGGSDGKTLFMTCRTGIYAIDLKIAGIMPMD
ncbi:MAG: SMP-30/gluconolactonase/LRE family protein [Cytophagales bacterium]|nr:SMP-30/gluconolactonase/LRE family protein [Cytophagales bacterium]